MLKVLAVNETLGYGGAERLLVSLLPEFRKWAVEVEVLALWKPYPLAKELECLGFKVHRGNLESRFSWLQALRAIRRVFFAGNFDIVWGHNYFGNLYSSYFRFLSRTGKIVLTHHNSSFSTEPPKNLWQRIRVALEVFGGKFLAHKTVAVSRSVAKDYEKAFDWKNIEVVHNGIPCKHLPASISHGEKNEIRTRYKVSPIDFLCIVPARLAPEKGHRFLIEALGALKAEKRWCPVVLLLGSGPLLGELKGIVGKYGLEKTVRFSGNVTQNELFSLLQSADAFLLPSLREPFGIAAAEAMALGCPTIVSRVDGLVELVGESETVVFCRPGDSVSIAKALWRVFQDRTSAQKMAQEASSHVFRNFDVSVVAEAWKNIFFAVMEAKQ